MSPLVSRPLLFRGPGGSRAGESSTEGGEMEASSWAHVTSHVSPKAAKKTRKDAKSLRLETVFCCRSQGRRHLLLGVAFISRDPLEGDSGDRDRG
mmetsp:Transcript_59586/g.130863  ORF Transcript_59586/g.130863 Transcript_59586/m.130863 type:complete len:95 (-) Transcript_59586:22-306(-)